jgi:hypothetical protein
MIIYEKLARIYQEEMHAEAERWRLINMASNRQHRMIMRYAKSLNWMGNVMCNWGDLLERRFGDEMGGNHSKSIEDSIFNDL